MSSRLPGMDAKVGVPMATKAVDGAKQLPFVRWDPKTDAVHVEGFYVCLPDCVDEPSAGHVVEGVANLLMRKALELKARTQDSDCIMPADYYAVHPIAPPGPVLRITDQRTASERTVEAWFGSEARRGSAMEIVKAALEGCDVDRAADICCSQLGLQELERLAQVLAMGGA